MAAKKINNMSIITSFYEKTVEQPFFCIDVETTGLSVDRDRITNFGCVQLKRTPEDVFEVVNRMNILINPERHISQEVVEKTGITDEMVKNARTYKEAFPLIKKYIGNNPIIIGYNSNFDIKFINAMYKMFGEEFVPSLHVDVFPIVKEKIKDTENHKLQTVAPFLKVDEGLTFHHALDDVIATYRVFDCLRKEYDKTELLKAAQEASDLANAMKYPIVITNISRWKKFNIDRIYITNSHNISIYYDCKEKTWESEEIDIESIKPSIYKYAGVSTDTELEEKYS